MAFSSSLPRSPDAGSVSSVGPQAPTCQGVARSFVLFTPGLCICQEPRRRLCCGLVPHGYPRLQKLINWSSQVSGCNDHVATTPRSLKMRDVIAGMSGNSTSPQRALTRTSRLKKFREALRRCRASTISDSMLSTMEPYSGSSQAMRSFVQNPNRDSGCHIPHDDL